MKKTKKRIGAVLLALCMFLSLAVVSPASAFAEGEDAGPAVVTDPAQLPIVADSEHPSSGLDADISANGDSVTGILVEGEGDVVISGPVDLTVDTAGNRIKAIEVMPGVSSVTAGDVSLDIDATGTGSDYASFDAIYFNTLSSSSSQDLTVTAGDVTVTAKVDPGFDIGVVAIDGDGYLYNNSVTTLGDVSVSVDSGGQPNDTVAAGIFSAAQGEYCMSSQAASVTVSNPGGTAMGIQNGGGTATVEGDLSVEGAAPVGVFYLDYSNASSHQGTDISSVTKVGGDLTVTGDDGVALLLVNTGSNAAFTMDGVVRAETGLISVSSNPDVVPLDPENVPDVSIWKFEGEQLVAKEGQATQMEHLFGGTFGTPTIDSTYAEALEASINYILHSVLVDESGNELGSDAGTMEYVEDTVRRKANVNADGSTGEDYITARADEVVKFQVRQADGYELVSVSEGGAILTRDSDGNYTLTVPYGGGVEIVAVLKAIQQMEEQIQNNDPEPEDEEEPEEETTPDRRPVVIDDEETPLAGFTWADIIRASDKNAELSFDAEDLTHTVFEVCGDYAQAIKERQDVTVEIVFTMDGERVSITIEPETDVVGALAKEDLTDHMEVEFTKLAELLELTPEAYVG